MPPSTLVCEATRRSGVLWVSSADVRPTLVWHLWHDDAAYVVCGGDEQVLPPLGPTARVAVRSKAGALVVEWDAAVSEVVPGSERWDEVTPLLAAERLNAVSVQDLPGRWAAASTVLRLAP
ncbi:MAG: hypothetical protein JWN08_195 [Frankiales bacterium]|nr:hypothetical protein [Frankiales bacterium]